MIIIKKKILLDGVVETHDFRQFESLDDAKNNIDEERLLVFINTSILNHDRNQLRKHKNKGDELEIALYKEQKRFSYL